MRLTWLIHLVNDSFAIYLSPEESLNIDVQSIHSWKRRNQQAVIFRWSSSTMHDVPRSSSLLRESPYLLFYFLLLSRQLILSPSSLLSSIPFITKAHIHGSAKLLNRTIFLVCRFSSARIVCCKFSRILLVTVRYSIDVTIFGTISFIWLQFCLYELIHMRKIV